MLLLFMTLHIAFICSSEVYMVTQMHLYYGYVRCLCIGAMVIKVLIQIVFLSAGRPQLLNDYYVIGHLLQIWCV